MHRCHSLHVPHSCVCIHIDEKIDTQKISALRNLYQKLFRYSIGKDMTTDMKCREINAAAEFKQNRNVFDREMCLGVFIHSQMCMTNNNDPQHIHFCVGVT